MRQNFHCKLASKRLSVTSHYNVLAYQKVLLSSMNASFNCQIAVMIAELKETLVWLELAESSTTSEGSTYPLAAGIFTVYDCQRFTDCQICLSSRFDCVWHIIEGRCLSSTDSHNGYITSSLPLPPNRPEPALICAKSVGLLKILSRLSIAPHPQTSTIAWPSHRLRQSIWALSETDETIATDLAEMLDSGEVLSFSH